jgi:AbrB family looped-hinge helix DNA binding protein
LSFHTNESILKPLSKRLAMQTQDITLAERGQIVIPKEARDALGLKPGCKLQISLDGNRLVVEKKVSLDLGRWVGKAIDDGLSRDEALSELRGRPVPWNGETPKP